MYLITLVLLVHTANVLRDSWGNRKPAKLQLLTDFSCPGIESSHHILLRGHDKLLGTLGGLQGSKLQLSHVLLPPSQKANRRMPAKTTPPCKQDIQPNVMEASRV